MPEEWNIGIMEDGFLLKTQYSSIPSFQVPKEAAIHKSFRYDNSYTSIKSVLDKSEKNIFSSNNPNCPNEDFYA